MFLSGSCAVWAPQATAVPENLTCVPEPVTSPEAILRDTVCVAPTQGTHSQLLATELRWTDSQ